ncbi:Facilitated trehalose transporter Tret1 [Oopsacas minuta]|uniref:Facilitated trehalose transporter Tret1 n=1 Tax=Oopsacas minuta TaxID=111878 RepID=A0AAV7KCT7_9METZ|nr:Facilitated trehalose transporter Tret1 [Oopsacas minuta]
MLGYSFGLPSPIALEIKSSNILDDYQFGIFSGIFYLAAAISGLIAIPMMYWLGRKSVIVIAAIISAGGWILLGSSRLPELLICARVVIGLGSGLSTPIVPIYIAELANKNTRGRHLSVVVSIDLEKKALQTLETLRCKDYDALEEVKEIIQVVAENKNTFLSKISLLFKLYHLKALFVVSLAMISNQSSGVNLIGSYSSELLNNDRINPNVIGLVMPIGQIAAILVTLILIEKIGRKILFILSLVGIILALFLMGTYLLLIDQICPLMSSFPNSTLVASCESEYLIAWPILTFVLFNLAFSSGNGPIGFILLGELIPQKVKNIVSGFGTFILFMTAFLIVTFYPIITNQIPRAYFIYALAVFNIVLCILIATLTPESKGKSVGELEKLFQENTVFCCKKTVN